MKIIFIFLGTTFQIYIHFTHQTVKKLNCRYFLESKENFYFTLNILNCLNCFKLSTACENYSFHGENSLLEKHTFVYVG